ncbi:fumarylacetoacetate hydrolase family protein [Paraburkholderia sp. LEh10]|uniref:fumarylacetoacetate hydrolase family protein n=1 Tax=Paraburkholderia sp. LEh10 TaxID=2821353 RepID=UPI001AE46174|nr:fumarylacetoacetate hydrolase family protein [Paraburkholderia sp. LEh10]MBP0590431.1 fumarylacetoacetate hydrolase family protein [Paraburkholderia sp. LEh10]
MKICRFMTKDGITRVGSLEDDHVREIEGADNVVLAASDSGRRFAGTHPLTDVQLLTPIPAPRKILGVGLNYLDHINEGLTARKPPDFPVFFNKQVSSIVGPGDAIHLPLVSDQLDYEGELGVVIGRECRHVPEKRASEVIAGYVIVNDVSVRDWQRKSPTITLGKSFDTHCPVGPWLVTPDEIGNVRELQIRTSLNGVLMQDFSTADMLFGVEKLIEVLTTCFTLEPGDIIATGTGQGVGIHRNPPRWMQAGDIVRVEITGVGILENPVIAEPETTAWR